MVRNILILVVVCILGYLGYYAYRNRAEKASINSGDFTCQGCDSPEEHARFLKENAGETPDGDSEHKTSTARRAADTATTSAPETPKAFGQDAPSGTSTMVDPSQAPVVVPTTQSPGAVVAGVPAMGMPATDTVSPNPPNGMTFAGKGTYQWYRQGNLTWRVDTTSGRSCIIYATMEEWHKPMVLSHGCGSNA